MLKFVCETCRHLLGTEAKNLGQWIRCPHCGNPALVDPVEDSASAEEVRAVAPPGSPTDSATSMQPSAAIVAVRANREANLPVMRQTPGPLVRYCVVGFDKAIRMKVRLMVNAESAEAAQQRAEGSGMEVHSVTSQRSMMAEESADESAGRQHRRSG